MKINRRIVTSVLSIGTAGALLVGATFAFFTDTDNSTGNTLSTGTLEIDIVDQNSSDPFQAESLVTNWQPGEEKLVNFDVKNIGTLPVNLRGFASGTWNDAGLDSENRVKVVKVERYDGGWQTLMTNAAGITGYFYDSSDGTSGGTLFDLAPGSRSQFQLTVKLDENAGNNFQNKTFTASLQVEAKQLNAPGW